MPRLRILRWALIGWPVIPTFCDKIGSVARVEGRSMQPTLNPDLTRNDIVVLERHSKYNISRGEVVSVVSPKDPRDRTVKRVIALEGDIVLRDGAKHVIPVGHIWIEGDNAKSSLDSKQYGPVPLGLIDAKVTWIIWPLDRFQQIETIIK